MNGKTNRAVRTCRVQAKQPSLCEALQVKQENKKTAVALVRVKQENSYDLLLHNINKTSARVFSVRY